MTCLAELAGWSNDNPDHLPIFVMLELTASDPRVVAAGGVASPPWNVTRLDALDAEIRSVFDPDELLTPDDVRRPRLTLDETVRQHGWPPLEEVRGRVAFLLDTGDPVSGSGAGAAVGTDDGAGAAGEASTGTAPEPGAARGPLSEYRRDRPSLEGRVAFVDAPPGDPSAAYVKRDDPRGAAGAEIARLVAAGYLVRTRADVPLETVMSGDTSRREAALASGAQLVSTDFPADGMAARYGTGYVARLPGGAVARCNPVNAPPGCDPTGLGSPLSMDAGR